MAVHGERAAGPLIDHSSESLQYKYA